MTEGPCPQELTDSVRYWLASASGLFELRDAR